ncbi:MAG: hypothetical protein ACFFFY_10065, partial [Promethearchaeota archaeon]
EPEKIIFNDFMRFYSICPMCKKSNHALHLKKLYALEENEEYKNELIHLMSVQGRREHDFSINTGLLCCDCFKSFFNRK